MSLSYKFHLYVYVQGISKISGFSVFKLRAKANLTTNFKKTFKF